MVWVYVWLVMMLLDVDKQAWLFLAVITVFNLILDFTVPVLPPLGPGAFGELWQSRPFNRKKSRK